MGEARGENGAGEEMGVGKKISKKKGARNFFGREFEKINKLKKGKKEKENFVWKGVWKKNKN